MKTTTDSLIYKYTLIGGNACEAREDKQQKNRTRNFTQPKMSDSSKNKYIQICCGQFTALFIFSPSFEVKFQDKNDYINLSLLNCHPDLEEPLVGIPPAENRTDRDQA